MREASKTQALRDPEFTRRYFSSSVLDIGAGEDLVVPHAKRWDLEDGDANEIADVLEPESFDCVHSSHCLEHMKNVPKAVQQWWKLVKPGGHMILVVPDEDLYEQGFWPSRFNSDHKATFRIGGERSWSPVSYDILKLVNELEGARILSAKRQREGYHLFLKWKPGNKIGPYKFCCRLRNFSKKLIHLLRLNNSLFSVILERWFGIPVDQTLRQALAQIEVIVKKKGAEDA